MGGGEYQTLKEIECLQAAFVFVTFWGPPVVQNNGINLACWSLKRDCDVQHEFIAEVNCTFHLNIFFILTGDGPGFVEVEKNSGVIAENVIL